MDESSADMGERSIFPLIFVTHRPTMRLKSGEK